MFTRGYNWNNDVKMPLVKLSDINWQIVFMGLQKETGTSNIVGFKFKYQVSSAYSIQAELKLMTIF